MVTFQTIVVSIYRTVPVLSKAIRGLKSVSVRYAPHWRLASLRDGGSKRMPDHRKNIPLPRISDVLVICENFHASVWYDNCNFFSPFVSRKLRERGLPRISSGTIVTPAEKIMLPSLRLIVTSGEDA